ncbi:MAG: branched-chain amino acid ABC transporter permease, partial [Mesorhizobium sp.]
SAFFSWTRIGLAFRAVADDQFAALAVGLRLHRIWGTVWTAAGFVALVAGLLWGARLGVQFSLSLIVLKALPVLVLGGFDSIL